MASNENNMETTVRLFPKPRPIETRSVPLSILDATVARFAAAGGIWIFDRADTSLSAPELVLRLRQSFEETLSSFSHWAGQLQWAPVKEDGPHTNRFHRPMVVYGAESDPGVEWTVVNVPLTAAQIVPTAAERVSGAAAWSGDDFPQQTLLASKTPLALINLRDCEGLPGMIVQVSLLADNGYAVAVKLSHPLADAESLALFMKYWSAKCSALNGKQMSAATVEEPTFDPSLLDSRASGDIDADEPDEHLLAKARSLPIHRFDWWDTTAPGFSPVFVTNTENSKPPAGSALLAKALETPVEKAPWHTWDLAKPVSYTLLHFSGDELARLRDRARAAPGARPDVSRLDALQAHVWAAANRARGFADADEEVFMALTLGVRARARPPLPAGFVGSPVLLTHVRAAGRDACRGVGDNSAAAAIREAMSLFTPDAVGAVLHERAHEVAPQRLWSGFLGERYLLVASWVRTGVYDVAFEGSTSRPRYVHAVIPKIDGCLQLIDAANGDGGVDVALYLESTAMGRLLADEGLRKL